MITSSVIGKLKTIRVRPPGAKTAPGIPAGELAGGGRGPFDDRSDLVERDIEHVVQHERESFGGRECVQDDEQREPDGVGQERFVRGVGRGPAGHRRLAAGGGFGRLRADVPRTTERVPMATVW